MIKTYLKYNWWKYLIIVLVLAIDLLTKVFLVPQNQDEWVVVTIIPGVFQIYPTRNTGAGFSILSGQIWLLIAVTLLFLLLYTVFNVFYKNKSKLYRISSGLIVAGAIGNLIDRILFGYVRDFLYFELINFPVFNVADVSLTIGIALLLVYIIFFSSKKEVAIDNMSHTQIKSMVNNNKKICERENNQAILEGDDAKNRKNLNETQSQNGEDNAKDNNRR